MAVVIIAGALSLSATHNTSAARALPGRQLASVRQACQQWGRTTARPAADASADAPCSVMTTWMSRQLRVAHLTGSMMWGSPASMRSTCLRWMATGPAVATSGPESQAWCDGMVTSMTRHIGNWDNWMMNGHMMGT